MKRVLSVQDLSCLGKCSLTVAMPTLSVMGCECTVLPTTLLSTHTAFPQPHIRSLTEDLGPIVSHWQTTGVRFDAISVGYLADPQQAVAVAQVLDAFPAPTVIDPVMGDHGRLYSTMTKDHVSAVAELCRRGTVLLPNVTEAAFLTGLPYRQDGDEAYCRQLLCALQGFGTDAVIITGIAHAPGKTGVIGWSREDGFFLYEGQKQDRRCHGTGDLFAAVFTGAWVQGRSIPDSAGLAARFVEQVIAATPEDTPFGICFEEKLPWLGCTMQGSNA